jgi:hypothetical protein
MHVAKLLNTLRLVVHKKVVVSSLPERPLNATQRNGEFECVNHIGNRALERLSEEQMHVLRHDDITGNHKPITLSHPLQRILEKIARFRPTQMLKPVIATERKEVKAPCVFESYESSRHREKGTLNHLRSREGSKPA